MLNGIGFITLSEKLLAETIRTSSSSKKHYIYNNKIFNCILM